MITRFIFPVVKFLVRAVFYIALIFSLYDVYSMIENVIQKPRQGIVLKPYSTAVTGTLPYSTSALFSYSPDSLLYYSQVADRFTVRFKPHSGISYYKMIMKLFMIVITIGILYTLKRIFEDTNLHNPFNKFLIKRLYVLASLFIIKDVFKLADFYIVNQALGNYFESSNFKVIVDTGSDFATGLIVLIITVIFQRGVALQEENALTV